MLHNERKLTAHTKYLVIAVSTREMSTVNNRIEPPINVTCLVSLDSSLVLHGRLSLLTAFRHVERTLPSQGNITD